MPWRKSLQSEFYYLDGYNLLFSLIDSKKSLASQRETVIRFLQKQCALRKVRGALVFDGAIRTGEESGRSYTSPLEVIYTAQGQSADTYILEHIELAKNRRRITVVTNDRGLTMQARCLQANSLDNETFLQWLLKKKKASSSRKQEAVDTQYHIDRLLKIFEEKLQNPEDD